MSYGQPDIDSVEVDVSEVPTDRSEADGTPIEMGKDNSGRGEGGGSGARALVCAEDVVSLLRVLAANPRQSAPENGHGLGAVGLI